LDELTHAIASSNLSLASALLGAYASFVDNTLTFHFDKLLTYHYRKITSEPNSELIEKFAKQVFSDFLQVKYILGTPEGEV